MVKGLRAAGFVMSLLASASAFAARQARVDVDKADVHQGPGTDTPVLTQLTKGIPLAVSNLPTNGFYKVRTPMGDVGWVLADSLVVYGEGASGGGYGDPFAAPGRKSPAAGAALLKETAQARYRPALRLRAVGGVDFFTMTDFGVVSGFDSLNNGFHAGGEMHFLLGRKVSMAVRVEAMLKTKVGNDLFTNTAYQWSIFSTPTMVGVSIELSSSRRAEFHLSALGGIALNTSLTTRAVLAAPNITIHEAVPFTGLFKADAAFRLSGRWKGMIEAGYRDLKTKAITPGTKGNGSELYEDSNNEQRPFSLDLSGLVIGIGLQYDM